MSDYKTFKDRHLSLLVDKTEFLNEVMENKKSVQVFSKPRRMGKTMNLTMLKEFLINPTEFSNVSASYTREVSDAGVLMIECPKERTKIKSFDKWRDMMLMHFRNNVPDCQKLEVNIGISDEDVEGFMVRVLKASASGEKKRIYLMIDDFDLPLLRAAADGYIEEAYDFYRLLFPISLSEEAAEAGIDLKIIMMVTCHLNISDCIINDKCTDSSLVTTVLKAPSKSRFGFSIKEIEDLCEREGLG